jgi:hypothetical protein
MLRKFFFPCFLSLTTMALSSCHNKGCTNRDAVNFDITADEDDGSCVVCQTKTDDIAYKITYLRDNSSSSAYYGQLVATVYLHQFSETPNDKLCGGNKNNLNIKLKNLKNQNMYITSISMSDYSGPVDVYLNTNINATIAPGQIADLGDFPAAIQDDPALVPITLDSLAVASYSITYY